MLRWFEQLIGTVRECPEVVVGTWSVVDVPASPSGLIHRFDAPEGAIVLLHDLADEPVRIDVGTPAADGRPWEMFADGPHARPTARLKALALNGFGYRWIRLRRGHGT